MFERRCWASGALLLLACGGSDEGGDEWANSVAPPDQAPAFSGADNVDDDSAAEPGAGPAAPVTPAPEREIESSFLAPVVTGRWIWTANPESGRVARIDAVTREVTTLAAGLSPTYLAAVDGATDARAIVINAGGSDATLFRQAGDGSLSALDIPIHQGATAWTVAPSGRFAIAWSDAAQLAVAPDPTEGLQDVTVIDLAADPPRPARFSVGYRPLQVTIDASEARAYAVTRDGISVIELGDAPRVLDDVLLVSSDEQLAGDLGAPVLEDLPLTRDGRFALVRFAGAPRLKIIELATTRSQVITLPGEVSDVDIAGDSDRAVAVVRSTGQVAVFELGAALADPTQVTLRSFSGETLGSAALPDAGSTALFFTTAVDSDRLAILDTAAAPDAAGAQRVLSLKAPIAAVFASPEGSHAIALLETAPGSERAGAFSAIPVADALPPKIEGTDAPPFRVTLANTASGLRALVTVRDDAASIFGTYLVRMPSLQVDRIPLSSPPIAAGVLPDDGLAFVAQRHPEGRITFINLESAEAETLTGFELSSRVVDGASR